MDPSIWGAGAWHLLHRVSTRKHDRVTSKEFYMSLKDILPCRSCRANIQKHVAKLPFPVGKNKGKVAEWVYGIHNLVNDDLGVQGDRPTFADIKKKFAAADDEKEEWIFIRGIAKVHPGIRKITPEYEAALTAFLEGWLGHDVPFNVRSRSAFQTWIKKTLG